MIEGQLVMATNNPCICWLPITCKKRLVGFMFLLCIRYKYVPIRFNTMSNSLSFNWLYGLNESMLSCMFSKTPKDFIGLSFTGNTT